MKKPARLSRHEPANSGGDRQRNRIEGETLRAQDVRAAQQNPIPNDAQESGQTQGGERSHNIRQRNLFVAFLANVREDCPQQQADPQAQKTVGPDQERDAHCGGRRAQENLHETGRNAENPSQTCARKERAGAVNRLPPVFGQSAFTPSEAPGTMRNSFFGEGRR